MASVFLSLGATLVALLALLVSIPFWLIPPLVLILPPLIWGWLTYRVMSYDMLAEHASREERQTLLQRHRPALFGIGVITGYLGAAPSIVWASGVLFVAMAPVLVPVAIWIYTLVFAFSALWFAHYLLAALEALRAERPDASPTVLAPVEVVEPALDAQPMRSLPSLPTPPHDMNFGLIIVGDEILSGKREDKHLPKVIELLGERGLALSWARYVGDDRERITADLARAFASGDVVFCCGGIGATPDDHTRQCGGRGARRAARPAPRRRAN